MRIRKTVFGSAYERMLYKALLTRWSDKLRIYPCLPFFNVIEVDEPEVPQTERNFLLKTSVDFTLCDESDQPLLSIEFDGLGNGFSRDGEYVPRGISSKDPHRKWKLDTKLQVCRLTGYPLFVVSYDEATPISAGLNLAIVDGIIGQFLAHRDVVPQMNELLKERQDAFNDLPEAERHDAFQDLIIEAEVNAEYEWDLIVQETAKFRIPLFKGKLYKGSSTEWLEDPGMPHDLQAANLFRNGFVVEPELMRRRLDALQGRDRIGCRVTLDTTMGRFSETAWIRNVEGPGVSSLVLAEEIAELLVHKRAFESLSASRGVGDST